MFNVKIVSVKRSDEIEKLSHRLQLFDKKIQKINLTKIKDIDSALLEDKSLKSLMRFLGSELSSLTQSKLTNLMKEIQKLKPDQIETSSSDLLLFKVDTEKYLATGKIILLVGNDDYMEFKFFQKKKITSKFLKKEDQDLYLGVDEKKLALYLKQKLGYLKNAGHKPNEIEKKIIKLIAMTMIEVGEESKVRKQNEMGKKIDSKYQTEVQKTTNEIDVPKVTIEELKKREWNLEKKG
ncbi:hypothetical protein ACFLZV_06115, partial [Candidatus Margulisiibacteriota bacterium]